MNAFDTILTRRSVRTYINKKIPNTIIQDLLEAAISAPSAGNQQPWQFIIINKRETLDKTSACLPNGKLLQDADKAILVCGDLNIEKHKGYWPIDCSAATQNILLAAHAKGIGACWLGVYPREERVTNLQQLFKTPDYIIPFSVISLGYSNQVCEKVDRYDPSRIHRNIW
jgi:nitroreductase